MKNRWQILINLLLLAVLFCAPAKTATEHNPLTVINSLMEQRQFVTAEQLLRLHLAAARGEQRNVLLYLLGLALTGQGKYKAAVECFRLVLDKQPHITRVRVALGRVLFIEGNDSAAEKQFDYVLADSSADSYLHQQARQHLAAIRRRNGWRYSTSFSITENSNITAAADSDAVIYIAGLPFSADAEKERGYSAAWGIDANYRGQSGTNQQLEMGVALNGGVAPSHWDNSSSVQLYGGRRFLFTNAALGVSAVSAYHLSQGHPSARSIGIRANHNSVLPQDWRNVLSLQYIYQDSLLNDAQDARVAYVQNALNFGLSAISSGRVHISATRSRAKEARYGYVAVGAGIELNRNFPLGLAGGASFSITRTLFDGESSLVDIRERHIDRTFSISLLKRDWRIWGFAPRISITHNIKKSNIAISSYDNVITQLSFTKNF